MNNYERLLKIDEEMRNLMGELRKVPEQNRDQRTKILTEVQRLITERVELAEPIAYKWMLKALG